MTPAQARAFVAEVQKERGTTPPAGPVTSMDQLLDVIQFDEIGRFEDAVRFVAGKPGVDAMTLHATVELIWSDGFSTVAKVLEEAPNAAQMEQQRLTQERDAGRKLTDAEEKTLAASQKEIDFATKAHAAVVVLAKDHLTAAQPIVMEVVRQFPTDERATRVATLYYLLSEQYELFDTTMDGLKAAEAKDAGLKYVRAVESLSRYGIRKDAAVFLRAALELNPKLVRAKAKLVLAEESIEAKYAALQNLRAVAPQHPIVGLTGPSITSAYESSTSLSKAREARQPGAAQPAPVQPAPAQPAAPPPAAPPPGAAQPAAPQPAPPPANK
jgi:hypothetical protein